MTQWPIESIAAVAAGQNLAPAAAALPTATPDTGAIGSFANLIESQISGVNGSVGAAETAMQDLAAGKPVELHDVMISLERARLSVQTFVQVRNKLIESYQDLMRMQL
jgi:flagellar hook-basal body complex protein FliE